MEEFKNFTDFLHDLKSIQTKKPLYFPKIAILGSPGSGKTSLLQSILGVKLFPDNFSHKLSYVEVTLKTAENISGHTFEILNTQEQFKEIRPFRSRLVDFISTLSSNYEQSVSIVISAATVPYLTLIDLPSLAPLNSEITDDAFWEEESTKKKIVKKAVKDDKTLIVCVLSALDNFSDSRALEYAREYDPQTERTIGVITKYDVLETDSQKGEIKRIINGKDFPLKHGYNLLSLNTNFRNLVEGDDENDESSVAAHVFRRRTEPIEFFLMKLRKIFCFTFRTILPGLFNEFQAKSKTYEEELEDLGEDLDVENADVFRILWKMTSNFCLNFRDALSGCYMGIEKGRTKKTTLACGAFIRSLLHSLYMDEDYNSLFEAVSYTDEEIANTIRNHNSVSLEGFLSANAFKLLVCDRLKYLEDPAYDTFQKILEALQKASSTLLDKHFARLPELKVKLDEFLTGYFAQEKANTMKILKPIIEAQLHYVYCNDPEKVFHNIYNLAKVETETGTILSREEILQNLVQELKASCKTYCESVMFSLRDIIPKIIGQFFMDEVSNSIQVFLTDYIKKSISENPEILKLTEHQKELRVALMGKLKVIRKLKQYMMKDQTLYQFLKDPTLEETIFNKYQRRKDVYFKHVEESALKLKAQKRAELEALKKKKQAEKRNWMDRFKNWFNGKKQPPKKNIITQQPGQSQAQRFASFKAELYEETFVVPTRARANSSDQRDGMQKSNTNALITDFVMIESYCNADQEGQGKLLTRTDWMRLIAKGDAEDIPEESLVYSVTQGIPNEMRASIWTILAKIKKMKSQNSKFLYERLSKVNSKWDMYIEKDVPRTRNNEPFFKKAEYGTAEKLTRILKAYAAFDPELGYTQGMNEIVGVVLMVMSNYNPSNQYQDTLQIPKSAEKNTFWILVYLMQELKYRDSFKDSCPKLMENIFKFESMLREEAPDMLEHMEMNGVTCHSAFTHIFLTLACQHSPVEFSVRIIDVFLLKGDEVLFDVMMKVMSVCKKDIMTLRDEKLFGFFKRDIMFVCFEKYKKELNRLLPNA